MRVIPIDDFLETIEHERAPAAVPTSPIDGTVYDWGRIVSEGRAARTAADGGFWRIGQLALLVERRYRSGALKRFADEIGESLGTVRRLRWVAGAYDPNARTRFAGLSFSHFQAVATLPDRLTWLERARRGGWSVDRLVTESRKGTGSANATPGLRRPIESATRNLSKLVDQVDARALSPDERAVLAEAVDELAARVEELRARLNAPARPRSLRLAHSAVGRNHRKAAPARRSAARAR